MINRTVYYRDKHNNTIKKEKSSGNVKTYILTIPQHISVQNSLVVCLIIYLTTLTKLRSQITLLINQLARSYLSHFDHIYYHPHLRFLINSHQISCYHYY